MLLAECVGCSFDSTGTLLWSVFLDVPEAAVIRAGFLARNRELTRNPVSFQMLDYVRDGTALGDSAWLLLNTLEDDPRRCSS